MPLAKVSPVLTRNVSASAKNNILRKLRVPILAAAMIASGAFVGKAQARELEKDTFTPAATIGNDTIKPKPGVIITDTIVVSQNDSISVIDELSEDISKINENALGLKTSGSAAEELYTRVLSNISESGENPYNTIYLALCKQQSGNTLADVSAQIDDVIENMKIYSKDHNDETDELLLKNGSVSEFKYGKDNSKTGIVMQSLNITGLNLNEEGEQSNDSINKDNNDFNGNISYRMRATTDKAEVETNINAGSDNVDIQLAALYKTQTENGGNLSLSVNGRETMDGATTDGSAGASFDYNKDYFSTGLYYYYNRETDETGDVFKNTHLEGYLKYKQNVNLLAGIQNSDFLKYYYSELKLSGLKNLEDINTKLTGALSAEAGSLYTDYSDLGLEKNKLTNLDLCLMGGAYFKTDDISASLNGRISYNYLIDPDDDNESKLGLSVLGAFAKDNIAVSAMFSMFKGLSSPSENPDESVKSASNDINIATSVGFEIKNLLKGISPQFSYTSTSIDNKVQHFFNMTLKTSIEALKKAQQ